MTNEQKDRLKGHQLFKTKPAKNPIVHNRNQQVKSYQAPINKDAGTPDLMRSQQLMRTMTQFSADEPEHENSPQVSFSNTPDKQAAWSGKSR